MADGAPGALGPGRTISRRSPHISSPQRARHRNGVIVCPGGGYQHLAMDKEGDQIARWLNSIGVTAFVLKYRLGAADITTPSNWAMRSVPSAPCAPRPRSIASGPTASASWGSRPAAIWHPRRERISMPERRMRPTRSMSAVSRPDFLVLGLSGDFVHHPVHRRGSLRSSAGRQSGSQTRGEHVERVAGDRANPAHVPVSHHRRPAVPAENSVLFYMALRKAGVPAEMHIYEQGPHGVGLAPSRRSALLVAGAAGGLAARSRIAEVGSKYRLRNRRFCAIIDALCSSP